MHAPLDPAFQVEWKSVATLTPIAEAWRALAARAVEPNVFHEPAFALAAAPALAADVGALLVWSRQRLVGLLPVHHAQHRYGLCGALVGWAHDYGPLGVPLIDREHPAATIGAALDHIANDASLPGLLMLPLAPERGAFAAALEDALTKRGLRTAAFDRHQRALLAPAADRENYLEHAVSSGRRKELRRQRRRLADNAPVSFMIVSNVDEVRAALGDFLALEASGWKGQAGTAAELKPQTRTFMTAAVTALAAQGQARVARLMRGSQPIAALIMLRSGDTAWCWKIAYDESVAQASPGVQLMLDLTDDLLSDAAIARVDSCATAGHPMIDHIWRERLALVDRLIAVRASAGTFALACGIEKLRRGGVGTARALRNRLRGR